MKFFLPFLMFCTCCIFASAQEVDERTPFEKIRFIQKKPFFQHNGQWLEMVEIGGFPVYDLVEKTKRRSPDEWQKNFIKYQNYLLEEFKIERKDSIKVTYTLQDSLQYLWLPLKAENLTKAFEFYKQDYQNNRISRKHQKPKNDSLSYLNLRADGYTPQEEDWLSPEQVTHDLEYLEWVLVNRYSYLQLTGFDYQKGIDQMISDLRKGISKRDLAMQLKMFMAHFGDGHSRVSARYIFKKKEELSDLPFWILYHDGQYYAANPDKKDYYNKDFPQIKSINGHSMDELYALTKRFVAKTTEGFVHRNSLEYINYYPAFWLGLLDGQLPASAEIVFANGEKEKRDTIALGDLNLNPPQERHVLKVETLPENIGYLAMNDGMEDEDDFLDSLHLAMQQFKDTKGIIIDIRDNGGGSRAPLLALMPYFITRPVVGNVAKYRISDSLDIWPRDGYLDNRYAFPMRSSKFNRDEQEEIRQFKKTFIPQFRTPNEDFSVYHYLLLRPDHPKRYHYDKPVIVLVDSGCFSASDIFAAGIQQAPKVQLLGVTTGGGSGFSEDYELPHSEIEVRASRMVSYQPNGKLYDTKGVEPDIQSAYTLEDKLGQTDSMLQRAKEKILK